MVDWERVNDLRDEVGEDAFVEVSTLFMEEVEEVLERIGDTQAVSPDDLHFLKGCALNLGFVDMARACSPADDAAVSGVALGTCYALSKTAFLAGTETVSA